MRVLYIAWVKIVLVIVLASRGIYCSQFKQKCCMLKGYWTANIIESPEGVKSQTQGPVVLPNHTADCPSKDLTASQLGPNTSCTTNKTGTWRWTHLLQSPKTKSFVPVQSLFCMHQSLNPRPLPMPYLISSLKKQKSHNGEFPKYQEVCKTWRAWLMSTSLY